MSLVKLQVNGTTHEVDVDPSTPLLYVLRNDLDLRGPRFGGGICQCSGCTFLINGPAVRLVSTPERRQGSPTDQKLGKLEGVGGGVVITGARRVDQRALAGNLTAVCGSVGGPVDHHSAGNGCRHWRIRGSPHVKGWGGV